MSAYALEFAEPAERIQRPQRPAAAVAPAPAPAPAEPEAFASPEDMKRPRFVQAVFTCLSSRRQPLSIGPCLPQAALARVLDEIDRKPRTVSVCCHADTPEDIEIRDETDSKAPRLLLGIVHAGLSLAEARTALVALQSFSSPKGRK